MEQPIRRRDGPVSPVGTTRAAAAPGRGGGKELLVLAAGALVGYILYVAFRPRFRRLLRYFGVKSKYAKDKEARIQRIKKKKCFSMNHRPAPL